VSTTLTKCLDNETLLAWHAQCYMCLMKINSIKAIGSETAPAAFVVEFVSLTPFKPCRAVYPEQVLQMREWVDDCHWSDDCETEDFSDAQIIRGVNRFFDGGLEAFLETCSVAA